MLIPIKDVPVGRRFEVIQTKTCYVMLAKDATSILAQDSSGKYFDNENLSQLVELMEPLDPKTYPIS